MSKYVAASFGTVKYRFFAFKIMFDLKIVKNYYSMSGGQLFEKIKEKDEPFTEKGIFLSNIMSQN